MNPSDKRCNREAWSAIDRIVAEHGEYYDALAQGFETEEQDSEERQARNAAFINQLYRGGGDAEEA